MVSKFLSNLFVKNIIGIISVISVILITISVLLTCGTRHYEEIFVPDMTGMSAKQAEKIAKKASMNVEIIDSIYVKRMPKGAVIRQNPKPGDKVKKGRRILLTINAITPKMIPMPNLIGYSLRSAKAELSSRGLDLGKLIYLSDIATNNVLNQIYHGSEIKAGKMIPSESSVDLVLGLNDTDNTTSVPNVIGKKWHTAVDIIHESSLNVSKVQFDRNIRSYQDSLNAVVYSQIPSASSLPVLIGNNVSIRLTLDSAKIPSDTILE